MHTIRISYKGCNTEKYSAISMLFKDYGDYIVASSYKNKS